MKSLLTGFLLLLLSLCAQAQSFTTNNKEAIKNFAEANKKIDESSYEEAMAFLNKAIAADYKFLEAHALLADVMNRLRLGKQAVEEYKIVIAMNPEFNRGIYLRLSSLELSEGLYPDALRHAEKYLTYPAVTPANNTIAQKIIRDAKFSIEGLTHPVAFKPMSMGDAINTAADEYSPVATADETTLIFTRQIASNEDFYQSTKANDAWLMATPLSKNINTEQFNEGSESISVDGNYLFFTGCNRPDGKGRCDIYVTRKKGDDWDKPFSLSQPVNSPGWESQPSISADGRTLYFVSNRPGGYGGYDIWKSTLTPGGWGEPVNLGPNVNTPYSEQSPYIHPDDNTLYFCSNGWPGFGGMDLFVSRADKDGKWQKPDNLGSPINTNNDESGLSLTATGQFAFFSSNKLSGAGGYDIYRFEMPQHLRPNVVTYVKGNANDFKTKRPLEAAIEIRDLETDKTIYQNYSTLPKGNFLATLPTGKNYGLNISKAGYLFHSENFSLEGHEPRNPFYIQAWLQPIEVGSKSILKNIFFDTNKFDLKPESRSELKKLTDFLALNPTVRVEISGHTDDVGNDQSNQILSENRAKSVYNYLIAAKVNVNRLVFKGYGESQPIVPNTSDENRAQNRRTEFKVIAL